MNSIKEIKQDLQQAVFELVHPEPARLDMDISDVSPNAILSEEALKMMEYDICEMLRNYADDILDIKIRLSQTEQKDEAKLIIMSKLRL